MASQAGKRQVGMTPPPAQGFRVRRGAAALV